MLPFEQKYDYLLLLIINQYVILKKYILCQESWGSENQEYSCRGHEMLSSIVLEVKDYQAITTRYILIDNWTEILDYITIFAI